MRLIGIWTRAQLDAYIEEHADTLTAWEKINIYFDKKLLDAFLPGKASQENTKKSPSKTKKTSNGKIVTKKGTVAAEFSFKKLTAKEKLAKEKPVVQYKVASKTITTKYNKYQVTEAPEVIRKFPPIETLSGIATIQVIQIKHSIDQNARGTKVKVTITEKPLGDEAGEPIEFSEFLITGIQSSINERLQLTEYFTGYDMHTFGRHIQQYTFTAQTRQDKEANWFKDFIDIYNKSIGIDASLENDYRVIITIAGLILRGTLLNPKYSFDSNNPALVHLTFTLILDSKPVWLALLNQNTIRVTEAAKKP